MKRLAIACLALLTVALSVTAQEDFNEHEKTYKQWMKRPSLYKRTLARERLAQTRDVRAIEVLAKNYARPEAPKDQVQYLLASIACDAFNRADDAPLLDAWRARHAKATDAWLWYRVLRNHVVHNGVGHALELAANTELEPFLRAAALEAAARSPDPAVLAAGKAVLNNLPDDRERWCLVETVARILELHGGYKDSLDYRQIGEHLANMLDHETVPARSRLVIARTFQRMFSTPRAWLSSRPWLARFKGEEGNGEHRQGATFVGVETEGTRICYLIDLSDSMLAPLTLKEKEDLRGSDEGLPWDEIRTRFDAARECLRHSLKQLRNDQEFCVIGFGTEADMLKECTGMQQATEKRINAVLAELDAIQPGPAEPGRENGTLRGLTNMHGGLHRAFKVKSKGMVKDYEYVDWLTFEQGCDTIFLLSDGKQSWADWAADDHSDGQGAGDPETGKSLPDPDTDIRRYFGPYVHTNHMLDDLRRMNLFRKCEINCVGIGEADEATLGQIAAIGNGKLRIIGR